MSGNCVHVWPWQGHVISKQNSNIERTLELTSNALTNAGKHVTSNIACAHSQQNTKDSVF